MKTHSQLLPVLPHNWSKKLLIASMLLTSVFPSCQSPAIPGQQAPAIEEVTSTAQFNQGHTSETLEVHQITDQVYRHLSFLETQRFGKVPCNGMIIIDQQEAVIFDTPATDSASMELINWVEQSLGCKVKAVIVTHFHEDCLGGLQAFQQRNIPAYASNRTIALAKDNQLAVPDHGFSDELSLDVGKEKVLALYPGKGHTHDNVVGYFPKAEAMFGGCLIKELGAGKGNLADADTVAWPLTVAKLKATFPQVM